MRADRSPTCLHTTKKNPTKVPKRIHKAERGKLKREHLNELFLELAGSLELTEQNGKASILGETTRVVKDMIDQIKSLKKENAALLSETQYVTAERKELQDETCTLQKQISELKSIIKERKAQTNLDLNAPAIESQEPYPVLNPVFVIPACHNVQDHPQPNTGTNVSKPYPRYPTPSDSWPFRLLEKLTREVGKECHIDSNKLVGNNPLMRQNPGVTPATKVYENKLKVSLPRDSIDDKAMEGSILKTTAAAGGSKPQYMFTEDKRLDNWLQRIKSMITKSVTQSRSSVGGGCMVAYVAVEGGLSLCTGRDIL